MTTGRVLYQYHTGTLTFREEGLTEGYTGESFVEIHPDTAAEYGVSEGEYVTLTSRHGTAEMKAAVTERPSPGEVFTPMHYFKGGANNLTKEEPLDPPSKTAEYKVTNVQLTAEGQPEGERTPSEIETERDEPTVTTDD